MEKLRFWKSFVFGEKLPTNFINSNIYIIYSWFSNGIGCSVRIPGFFQQALPILPLRNMPIPMSPSTEDCSIMNNSAHPQPPYPERPCICSRQLLDSRFCAPLHVQSEVSEGCRNLNTIFPNKAKNLIPDSGSPKYLPILFPGREEFHCNRHQDRHLDNKSPARRLA